MTATEAPQRSWERAVTARLVNGLGVVAAILLAFGIQAWWDGQQEQRRVNALLDALEAEWRGELDKLDLWTRSLDINFTALVALIDAHQHPDVVTADSAAALLQNYVWITYRPAVAAANTLLATDLDNVRDLELRQAIAAWPSVLEGPAALTDLLSQIGLTELRAEYGRVAESMGVPFSAESDTTPCHGVPLYGSECMRWVPWGVPLGELGLHAIRDQRIAILNRQISTLLFTYRDRLVTVRSILQHNVELLNRR